jgi:small-conductance mechanosensitive channel
MESFTNWLRDNMGLGSETQTKILTSLAMILVIWGVRYLVLRVVSRRTDDVKVRYHWQKSLAYIAGLIGILAVGRIWYQGISSLATFLGLLSAGLAIAFKDILVDLAGWVFILWRRPFEVGDRIQIGKHSGDVIDLRIFQFSLLEIGNWVDADQSTGRVIHVPNGQVFTTTLANYTRGFQYIWNEIPVLITFESDWEAAKELLMEIAKEHAAPLSASAEAEVRHAAQKYMIFYRNLTPTVYTSVRDCGVLLTIRYLCNARQRRGTDQTIWEAILRSFAARDDIDFAYPTQRFFENVREGKPGKQKGPN